jgi:TATA-binding protein-associated factor
MKHSSIVLQDDDDDVRAVAAEALVPIAATLSASTDASVAEMRRILWDILLDLEDFSMSTGQSLCQL